MIRYMNLPATCIVDCHEQLRQKYNVIIDSFTNPLFFMKECIKLSRIKEIFKDKIVKRIVLSLLLMTIYEAHLK